MLRSAKQTYFDSLSTAGNKKFWNTVKLLNKQQVSIPTLQEDGVSAVTDEEKSNMLNENFSKCWNHSEPPQYQKGLIACSSCFSGLPPADQLPGGEDSGSPP